MDRCVARGLGLKATKAQKEKFSNVASMSVLIYYKFGNRPVFGESVLGNLPQIWRICSTFITNLVNVFCIFLPLCDIVHRKIFGISSVDEIENTVCNHKKYFRKNKSTLFTIKTINNDD